jgi:hypothetical protein
VRLEPDGPAAFSLHRAEIVLQLIGDGPSASGFIEATRDELTLRGVVELSDIRLYVTGPRAIAGFLVPHYNTEFTVRHVSTKRVTIGIEGKQLGPLSLRTELKIEAGCDDFRIDPGEHFGRLEALPKSFPPRIGSAELTGATPVPLSREPGKPPVAQITTSPGQPTGVALYSVGATHALVAVPGGPLLAFGWVPAARTTPTAQEVHDLGRSHRSRPPRIRVELPPHRCPHPVPLAAEAGGARRQVAIAAPGAPLWPQRDEQGPLRHVRLWDYPWLSVAADDGLLIRAPDLEGCR